MKLEINDKTLTEAEVASLCGISQPMVRKLVGQNILIRSGRNQYRLADIVMGFAKYYNIKNAGHNDEVDFAIEKALLTKAQREKAEIEVGIIKDNIFESSYITPLIFELLLGVRNRLLSVPTRCAPQLMAAKKLIEVQEIIKKEIYEALTELANFKPESLKRSGKDEK